MQQFLDLDCAPIDTVAISKVKKPHELSDDATISLPKGMNVVQLRHIIGTAANQQVGVQPREEMLLLKLDQQNFKLLRNFMVRKKSGVALSNVFVSEVSGKGIDIT